MSRQKPEPDPDLPGRPPADPAERDWQRIERLLDQRPLPARRPDVRMAVLARIQAERAPVFGWKRWLERPFFAASAWGLAGAVAGLLFVTIISSHATRESDAAADVELASAPLLTDDLAFLTQEMYENGDQL